MNDVLLFLYDSDFILNEVKNVTNYNCILLLDKKRFELDPKKEQFSYFQSIILVDNIFSKTIVKDSLNEFLQNNQVNIAAILPTFEGVVEIAGFLRTEFNVTGIKEKQAETLRNKYLMKKAVRGSGLPCADFEIHRNKDQAKEFINKYGYPIIIKPTHGYAILNTFLVKNERELLAALHVIEGDNTTQYLLESFIHGVEYHCDSVVIDNEICFFSIGKYNNNGIDTVTGEALDGTVIFPYNYNHEITKKIKIFNNDVITALGIERSICHLEVFVTESKEIFFGEIGARVPGAYIGKCIEHTHKVNLYKAFIDLETNTLRKDTFIIREGSSVFTGVGILPTKSGIISEISTAEDFKDIEGLLTIEIFNKTGDIINPRNSILDRTGYCMVEGTTYEEVFRNITKIFNDYKLVIK